MFDSMYIFMEMHFEKILLYHYILGTLPNPRYQIEILLFE